LAQTFDTYVQFGANDGAVGPRGRKSVRLEGYSTYTHGLIIADIAHMPENACGAWPSFWMLGPNWPSSGEIDIVEGVNFGSQAQYTLHSNGPSGTCSVKAGAQNGTSGAADCTVCYSEYSSQPVANTR
jgi:hypothetical protein